MNVSFSTSGGLATAADINKFESIIGFKLPCEYESFLLNVNGGKPSLNKFFYKDKNGPYTDSVLRSMFTLDDNDSCSLITYYDIYTNSGRIPNHIIPIGDDFGGNVVCISLGGSDRGNIYFWDHENEAYDDEVASYDNLHLLALSFSEFLDALQEE